ncbi:hypothetical protein ABZ379_05860 [Streptomyces canus]|uniref:hypothetical protein n=1 Tax=Streptomyces canus TaxID=58343 RepID=UPI00340FDF5E
MARTVTSTHTRSLVRTALERRRWPGNLDKAARVAAVLVDNAVRHGAVFPDGTVSLRLAVDAGTGELVIEAADAEPSFPGFTETGSAWRCSDVRGKPSGLWWITHYRGRLAWTVKTDDDTRTVGKVVQVILPAS